MNGYEFNDAPLREHFAQTLRESLRGHLGLRDTEDVELYLANMLVSFLHNDAIYRIRSAEGRRIESLAEMLLEGDVRFNADSFEREREVHRHIGDFLLFWSGLFPGFLRHLHTPGLNFVQQGKESYYVASTFDYDPYSEEARTLGKLSMDFEAYQHALNLMRSSFGGNGWTEGFSA